MFCSKPCLDSSWSRFHKFECGSLDQSLDNDNEYDIMILKIVFESLSYCGSLEKLQTLIGDSKLNATVFDFDLNQKKTNKYIEKNLLKAICSLKKGPTSDEDLNMAEWIAELPVLSSLCKTKAQREFLKNFIIKVMGIIDRNSYIFYCPSLNSSYVNEEIGSGVFPFASLINHSCSPNLYRVFVDNKQVFVVKKPIEAGQQLFVGYQ
jgi:SET domain